MHGLPSVFYYILSLVVFEAASLLVMGYISDAKRYCPLDRLNASTLRSASSALVHLLLEHGFVEPSPQDLGVVLVRSPSIDRRFMGRSTMV